MVNFSDILEDLHTKRLFIFDFDETLVNLNVNWEKLKLELSKTVKRRFGITMTFTPILENLEYLKTQLSEEQVLPILNQLKNGELYALNHYSTLQPIGYALFQQIVSYFVKNSQNERFIALLSNNFTDTIKAGAELYNFAQYVSFFVGRDMVKKIKPDPEGIKKIHEHFPNIQKSEIIYFGDSEKYDKMVAESYGVTFYLIRHPE